MVHLALCSIVGLSGRDGFMGKNVASPQHYIELYLHERLLHTIGFNAYPLLSSKTPPPPTTTTTIPPSRRPLPQCLLLKVTQSKLGQSSQVKQKRRGPIAVETGLCSVCLLGLIPLSLYIPPTSTLSSSPPLPPTHPTLLNTVSNAMSRVACNTSGQQGTGQEEHD